MGEMGLRGILVGGPFLAKLEGREARMANPMSLCIFRSNRRLAALLATYFCRRCNRAAQLRVAQAGGVWAEVGCKWSVWVPSDLGPNGVIVRGPVLRSPVWRPFLVAALKRLVESVLGVVAANPASLAKWLEGRVTSGCSSINFEVDRY